MGMTVEIEVGEICNRFGRAVRRHLAGTHEASKALSHFNVRKVRRMELVLITEKAGLDLAHRRGCRITRRRKKVRGAGTIRFKL